MTFREEYDVILLRESVCLISRVNVFRVEQLTGSFPGAMLCRSCCRALAITLSPTAAHSRVLQFFAL